MAPFVAGMLAFVLILAVSSLDRSSQVSQATLDHRDAAFKRADRICAEQGGAEAYDIQDQNAIVFECRNGRARMRKLAY